MSAIATAPDATTAAYAESRRHELRKQRLVMIDGSLTVNASSVEAGASERVYRNGYWGFASAPTADASAVARVHRQARENARAMERFGARAALRLPGGMHRGEHAYAGRAPLSPAECVERMSILHAWCRSRYPKLKSVQVMLQQEHHRKRLATTDGSEVLNSIQRAVCYVTLVAENDAGAPVELLERISGKGSLADLDLSLDALAPRLDRTHEHLQAKRHAVAARGGRHTVVMGPNLAGILAHEAMGHPCEGDLVLGGAVTRDLVGERIASELVTMIDYAHHRDGVEVMIPVYADDEGTPARDAVLIERGILKEFMQSRETAARLGMAPTGSARAYAPGDEPLVRMRNTAILPGTSRLDDMIGGVEDGYLLLDTSNGQADSTTEFMFGINLGYEIKRGKLGRAIRDTTVSGSAIKVLQSVDAVSDDMVWSCSGYCGKKQPMVVSMGGPAIRGRAPRGGA
jgi:TldD protein